MRVSILHKAPWVGFLLAFLFILAGCSQSFPLPAPSVSPAASTSYVRQTHPLLPVCPGCEHQITAENETGCAWIDTGHVACGYITAACVAPVKSKLKITKNGEGYAYNLESDGQVQVLPLSMGSGEYQFTVYTHLEGNLYQQVLQTSCQVRLEDELLPFLIPNAMVNYDENSEVVAIARQLTQNCRTDQEVVQQINNWITQNFVYDYDKAVQVQHNTSYNTNLEEMLREKKGICLEIGRAHV